MTKAITKLRNCTNINYVQWQWESSQQLFITVINWDENGVEVLKGNENYLKDSLLTLSLGKKGVQILCPVIMLIDCL